MPVSLGMALKKIAVFYVITLCCVSFCAESTPSLTEEVVPEGPTSTFGDVVPAEEMIESNDGTSVLGESAIAKQPHYIRDGQAYLKDGKEHSLYDFTTSDIADECKDICDPTPGCDTYHHVYLKRHDKCKKCGACVLRNIFYESIPYDCKDLYDHQRYTAKKKVYCDLPFARSEEACEPFFACYFGELPTDSVPFFVANSMGHSLSPGDKTDLKNAGDKVAPEEKVAEKFTGKTDISEGGTDWDTPMMPENHHIGVNKDMKGPTAIGWEKDGGPWDYTYDEHPFKSKYLSKSAQESVKKEVKEAPPSSSGSKSKAIDFAQMLRDTAANLEGEHPDRVAGYHSDDASLHQLLQSKAVRTLPHEFSKLFMDKDLPLSVLLSQPVGTAKCTDVAAAFKQDSSQLPVNAIDLFGEASKGTSTLLQSKHRTATILKKVGAPDDQNAKWIVLMRDWRFGKGHKRDPITLPDDDRITDFLRGVTIDPHRDAVFEMTPNLDHQKAGSPCTQWVVRHMREGVGTLAKAFEVDGRKHLKPILGKVTEKMMEVFDEQLKKKVYSDTDTKKYERQSKLFKSPRDHLKKLLETLSKHMPTEQANTDARRSAKFLKAMKEKPRSAPSRKLLGGGGRRTDPYKYRRRRNPAKDNALKDRNHRTRSGLTQKSVDNAYYQTQIDLLDRSDVCSKTWPSVVESELLETVHGTEQRTNPPTISALEEEKEDPVMKVSKRQGRKLLGGDDRRRRAERRRRRGDCRDPGNPTKNVNTQTGGNIEWAQNKPTRQSSQGWSGHPGRAVDGNTADHYGHNSCTHTHADARPWWQVDLMVQKTVKKIHIWNRGDCCGDRLSQFWVTVGDSRNDALGTYHWRYASSLRQGYNRWITPGHAVGRYVTIEGKANTWLTLCEVKIEVSDPMNSLSTEGQEAKKTCCECIASATGRALDNSNNQLIGRSYTQVYDTLAKTNPNPSGDPDWSGCVRTWTIGGRLYRRRRRQRRRARNVVQREKRDGDWVVVSSSGHNIPTIVAQANRCESDDGGSPNWCNNDNGCAVAVMDNECTRCECVGACSTFAGEVSGNNPHVNQRLEDLQMKCDGKDVQDMNCIKAAVERTFCFDIPGVAKDPSGVGNSCKQGNGVGQIVLSIVFWIIDFILGCALGFIAQPSFWSNMNGPNSDQRSREVYGAKELGTAVQGVRNEPQPTQAEFDDAYRKGQEKSGKKVDATAGKARGDSSMRPANSARSSSSKVAAKSGWLSGTNGKLAKAKVTSMRNSLKMSKLKAIVPCAISVMIGLVPIPGVGIAAAVSAFASCMLGCIMTGLGITLATFVFEICSLCIFDIIGAVLKHVCFPAHMHVQTAQNDTKRMDELQIGDKIVSGQENDTEVYLFSHRDHTTVSPFMELTLANGRSVMASPRHFFPVSAKCDGNTEDMYSAAIHEGMCLYSSADKQNSLVLTPVTKTAMVWSQGLFNPFTMNGQLMVNGVLASSHSDWFLDSTAEKVGMEKFLPSIYQAVLAPARWMYHVAGAETARKHLDEMQETLNDHTSANGGLAPYLEAASRLAGVLLDRVTAQFY